MSVGPGDHDPGAAGVEHELVVAVPVEGVGDVALEHELDAARVADGDGAVRALVAGIRSRVSGFRDQPLIAKYRVTSLLKALRSFGYARFSRLVWRQDDSPEISNWLFAGPLA